jgi:hypothetical protein
MNGFSSVFETGFAPVFMSLSDMLLLFYLCSGSREQVRKNRYWGIWFAAIFLIMVSSQLVFNGRTIEQANYLIFYAIHFLLLLVFSAKCSEAPLGARIYLTILSVLANDICLVLLISLMSSIFHFDFIDNGTYLLRAISHIVLLIMKIGVTVSIKKFIRFQIHGITNVNQALIIMLPAGPYFFLRNYAFMFRIDAFAVPLMIHYLDVLFGVFALTNMILSEHLSYRIRQNELLQVENSVRNQHLQYLGTLNTIETVNRKYHDLRHILRGIESINSLTEIKTYVKTIDNEIKGYELICNTGNKTLDIILSEKMHAAKAKDIELHVVADGKQWDKIQEIDIATIFGNALDNAIENSDRNNEPSLRWIEVRTGRVNDMLMARIENCFTHSLIKKQLKFVSTKTDRQDHGYGLQSIEMAIQKYHGDMTVTAENGLFTLNIVIPLPKSSAVEK